MLKFPKNECQNVYKYMTSLQSIFKAPINLLRCKSLSLVRRKFLLKRWRDDRTRYLFENYSDLNYATDRQMEQLLRCVDKIKKAPERYN